MRRDQEHRWSKAGSGRESAPALAAPKLRDDLGVVPGTGAASFQNNKFLPELFQTDHNQARPAGNEADTACDIVTCLNFILGIIGSLPGLKSPSSVVSIHQETTKTHNYTQIGAWLKTWPT